MKNSTPEKLADKWIRQMQKANFTPDQMLECLKLAREKYEVMVYKKNRYQELHNIFKGFSHPFPLCEFPQINGLIEAKKQFEELNFNRFVKITRPSFPSGGMITGNGILNSMFDVSNKKLIDGIDFVTSFKDYKKENFYFYSPGKFFKRSDIEGKISFTKDFFIEIANNPEVDKEIIETDIRFWLRYSDWAIKDFMLFDQKFIFSEYYYNDYKKTNKGFIFRHCGNPNIEFWLYNPQITGVNETRPFSIKELIEMQTSKIYAYSSIKNHI